MQLETTSMSFRKARTVSQTSTSFVSKIVTNTEPTGSGATATGACVIDLAKGGSCVQNSMLIVPYGTGSDNNTFSIRAIGWRSVGDALPETMLWIPVLIAEILCTLSSSAVGVAGKTIVATELFADTLSLTYGSATLLSNGANLVAVASVSLAGFQRLELSFSTGTVATDCNALIAML